MSTLYERLTNEYNKKMSDGCAFCRSNGKIWNNHTVKICAELSKCICGYCKEKGHTPKKCPKLTLKMDKKWPALSDAKFEAKPEAKVENWASRVFKSLSAEEQNRIQSQQQEILKQQQEKDALARERIKSEREEQHRQWKIRNQRRIQRQYGGSFWFFFVQGTKDDSENAKIERENENNQHAFQRYLQDKYRDNWLQASGNTEDDCPILGTWRWEEQRDLIREEIDSKLKYDKEQEEREQMDKEMKAKLSSGQISIQEYNMWMWDREADDDYQYQCLGDRWFQAQGLML